MYQLEFGMQIELDQLGNHVKNNIDFSGETRLRLDLLLLRFDQLLLQFNQVLRHLGHGLSRQRGQALKKRYAELRGRRHDSSNQRG